MTNEQHTAKKGNPARPTSHPSGAGDDIAPDERPDFEGRIDHRDEPELPFGHAEDPDRLTKSGRLNLEQVKDAIEEVEEAEKAEKDA